MPATERSLFDDLDDGLLIPSKVADLGWDSASTILDGKLPAGVLPKSDREKLKTDFERLSKPTARRLLRFSGKFAR